MTIQDKIDEYLNKHEKWQASILLLSELIQAEGLEETVKWGMPTYVHQDKNIVGIGAFKAHLSLWFFQGGLLKDEQKKLVNAQEGKTKAMRHWRFQALEEIEADLDVIKLYVREAKSNQDRGSVIKPSKKKAIPMPPELQEYFVKHKDLAVTFKAFSSAKQREYFEYIGEAKRAATKQKRLDKIAELIKMGKGLNDKYK